MTSDALIGDGLAGSQRLGEEAKRAASRPVRDRGMELPSIGREHQDRLEELARYLVQVREGMTQSTKWERRV